MAIYRQNNVILNVLPVTEKSVQHAANTQYMMYSIFLALVLRDLMGDCIAYK